MESSIFGILVSLPVKWPISHSRYLGIETFADIYHLAIDSPTNIRTVHRRKFPSIKASSSSQRIRFSKSLVEKIDSRISLDGHIFPTLLSSRVGEMGISRAHYNACKYNLGNNQQQICRCLSPCLYPSIYLSLSTADWPRRSMEGDTGII